MATALSETRAFEPTRGRVSSLAALLVTLPIASPLFLSATADGDLSAFFDVVLQLGAAQVALRLFAYGPFSRLGARLVVALATGLAAALAVPFAHDVDGSRRGALGVWMVFCAWGIAWLPRIGHAIRENQSSRPRRWFPWLVARKGPWSTFLDWCVAALLVLAPLGVMIFEALRSEGGYALGFLVIDLPIVMLTGKFVSHDTLSDAIDWVPLGVVVFGFFVFTCFIYG